MSSNVTATVPSATPSQPAQPSSAAPAPSSNEPSAVPPASSAAPAPSQPPSASAPPPAPSSNPPPAASSAAPPPAVSSAPPPAPSSAAPAPTTTPTPAPNSDTTRVLTASQAAPTTEVTTIVVTSTPQGNGAQPTVIVITSTVQAPNGASNTANGGASSTGSARPSTTDPTQLQNAQKESSGGLSTGGKTAIAVVIPVVVVALLVLAGLFFWRKRKQRKTAEDERRKEVEEYGFNPNHDPTLPPVGGLAMAEDDSGYRGWGNTATSSNRKASTTLTSGMTYSDSNSNPGGYNNVSPNSPTHGTYSDVQSNDPLVNGRRETLDSDGIGALGAANGAVAANSAQNATGVHRGPSNASSSYSAANHSDNSGEYPGMAAGGNPQEYYNDQGYYQSGPYGQGDPYGGASANQQPIIRDVSARRNTRIENPSVFPQQGNSGIAQNF
ncbi:hypothetical protein T440DRAFT_470536 [Plenodomus tracheiphilus IPT5]|uniref:Uncharacterized protein n=1 Tax=Plenodomus tracheiphilus IPT5 TaxID=1408161 RepID=A0A6A7AY12_9PLEO|nr:hypothetical protein T440DRAFT_470536 [Plenodomus tracheiphilus IPT5]